MSRVDLGGAPCAAHYPTGACEPLLLSKLIKVVFIAVLIECSLCDKVKCGAGNYGK